MISYRDKRIYKAEKKMKRKRMITTVLVFSLFLMLTACGSKPETEPVQKKQLVLWHYWELSYARQALRQMVNQFNEENPDVEITIEFIPDQDSKKQLALSMAEGTMPDIAIIDSSDVQYFNHTGYLVDVRELVDQEAYIEQVISSCQSADGKVSGLPVGSNCLVFFYNQDLLEAAGIEPPETLDEFAGAAGRLTGNGVYGCAFPALQSEESLFCFLPVLWAKEGSVRELDSEQSKSAFDFIRQLSESGAMSHETVNMTLSDVEREFKKGRVAMMFTTTMSASDLRQEDLGFRVGMAPLPVAPEKLSIVGGEVLTVTNGPNKEEAQRFLTFMADPERMKQYIDGMGYLAPREDVLEWQVRQNPELEEFVEILKTARTREFRSIWPQISYAVSETISKVILHEDTPETFKELAETVREIREEAE